MAINPRRDSLDLRGHRLNLLDWVFPQMNMVPMSQVMNWLERSRLTFDDDIFNMHRNLFMLEPLSTVDALDNVMQLAHAKESFELDYLKDAYEVGKDGKLYFKVYFNAKNFKPEEITVKAEENKLVVHAQKSTTKKGCAISESVGKTISLPPSVDRKHINATLTSDDVLVVEAPVNEPNYSAIELIPKKGLAIQPTQTTENRELQVKNREGLEVVTAEDGSKKLHVELKVDPQYEPKDIKVWASGNKIYVRGVKGKEEATSESSYKEHREFFRTFSAPEFVDASKTRAEVGEGHLVVEAPLYK